MIEQISDGAALEEGDPERLIVFCSSILAVRRGSFDYTDFAKDIGCTKLFLRDHQPLLAYHAGIAGLSETMAETAEFLRYFVDRLRPKRVSMMGTSSGGYAANLLGHLIGADDIHLQSTVTYLDPALRDQFGGGERIAGAFDELSVFIREQGSDPDWMDLRKVIQRQKGRRPAVRLYYAEGDAIDVLQAQHIADLPNVQAIPHASRSHTFLAAILGRNGTLEADLAAPLEALRSPAPAVAAPA